MAPTFTCSDCKLHFVGNEKYQLHLKSSLHLNRYNNKNFNNLICVVCNISFSSEAHWKRHFDSKKHMNRCVKSIHNKYICACKKLYKHRSSYNRHLKQCTVHLNTSEDTIDIYKADPNIEMQTSMLEQQQVIIQQQKKIEENLNYLKNTPTTNTNIFNKVVNNKFNLNIFLNEECKDAINMNEFINQIQVCCEDLEYSGKYGGGASIVRLFTNKINELGINKRPIHCSDLKRKILYVKVDNSWEKDSEQVVIKKSIEDISVKQIKNINAWKSAQPSDWFKDDDQQDKFVTITHSVVTNFNDAKVLNDVIKNVGIHKIDKYI